MFQSQQEQKSSLQIQIPWDKFTARGFFASLIVLLLLIFISPFIKISPPTPIPTVKTIPLELLNLGSGDGTGQRSGNLTAEGSKQKGNDPSINIEDAQNSPKDPSKTKNNPTDIDISNKLNPVNKVGNDSKNPNTKDGNDPKTVGGKNGDVNGNGLGLKGNGKGLGDGFGNIDWGGGGNRTVVNKVLPQIPKHVNTSAKIVLQFKVQPDGTVSNIIAKQKADPALELAAINALKKWRFNRLDDNAKVMVGTIPLTFILR